MEHLVQLFRALANRRRIEILRLLCVLGELKVSAIAEAASLGLTIVSGHLKVLAAAGIVWRRRSGRAVYYRLAGSAADGVTATALSVLRDTFRTVGQREPRRVAHADRAESTTRSDAALFASFTAFTHPRRLQILRHLAREGARGVRQMCGALAMSPPACLRHLDKLGRRAFVRRRAAGRDVAYMQAAGRGPVARSLLRAVLEAVGAAPE